jgi:glycine/D-amino acid oxidase-like deaminating enzyme
MSIIDSRCNAVEELSLVPELLNSPTGRNFSFSSQSAILTRKDDPPAYIDLAIIGGGPLGVSLACHLWHSPRLRKRIAILDSGLVLLQPFLRRMSLLRQRVMRSPYEHQLAPDGDIQLLDYARLYYSYLTKVERSQVELGLSGQRAVVPTDLFVGHAMHVIASHDICRFAYQFKVTSVEPDSKNTYHAWRITDHKGRTIKARSVILATGSKETPFCKTFSVARRKFPTRVQSAYHEPLKPRPGESIAIVGGGLSAGHLIVSASAAAAHPIWIVRGEDRFRCADVDTSYFRTEGVAGFRHLPTDQRVQVLTEEIRGSLMLEFVPLLKGLEDSNLLTVFRNCEVTNVADTKTRKLRLDLSCGSRIRADRVVVANGFQPDISLLPKGAIIIGRRFPLTDDNTLEVSGHPNLFVVGPMASLSLGPAARNIDGARIAAQTLLPILDDRLGSTLNNRAAKKITIKGTLAIDAPVSGRGGLNVVA